MSTRIEPRIIEIFKKTSIKGHRSVILMIGRNSKKNVIYLHYLWSKINYKKKSPLLWCFGNKKSSFDDLKGSFLNIKKSNCHENSSNFSEHRFCNYKDIDRITGNTFGMCVMQNFEEISPNILAKTVETVEGGGSIIFLLETENSLKNLHRISFKIYKKFTTNAYKTISGRFIDLFILSLFECDTFLCLDNNLNKIENPVQCKKFDFNKKDLNFSDDNKDGFLHIDLVDNLKNIEPLGSLISKTKTFDQAKSFLTFTEAIADRKKWSTIFLNSPRGRGKSSVMGLAVVSAITYGYSSIFVTAPVPENLNSFFAFLFIGLKTLNYIENKDYEIIQNPVQKCIERINIFSTHRQTIRFIFPREISEYKNIIELLVIDEGATIYDEIKENFSGPYLIFISSTTSGYEGTGRSLNLKLLNSLKANAFLSNDFNSKQNTRVFREVILKKPIRYSINDPVEKWLNELLCLDLDNSHRLIEGCPKLDTCKLYLVDRNTLFSGHELGKLLLQKIIFLFSISHYRNSPDDIQMLSDSPSHRILILISPFNMRLNILPDIITAIHFCYEGQINRNFSKKNMILDKKFPGDLIPWVISRNFLDPSFSEFSGIRIVRIATHSDVQNIGYGSKAISILQNFCELNKKKSFKKKLILSEKKKKLSSLIIDIENRMPPNLDYIGVSFSLNLPLLCFWRKNGFFVIYIRKGNNLNSTETNCIMVKTVSNQTSYPWFFFYRRELLKNFINLLSYDFRFMPVNLVYNIFENLKFGSETTSVIRLNLRKFISSYDFNRLVLFAEESLISYNKILDLLPVLTRIGFWTFFSKNHFSFTESCLLIAIGFQYKNIEEVKNELSLRKDSFVFLLKSIIKKLLVYIAF
jgi:N-acetyltransferase 10